MSHTLVMLEALNETLRHLDHAGDCAKYDPDPTYDSDGHIRMGRMPCPVCMVERAIMKVTGGVDLALVPVRTDYSTLTGLWFLYNFDGHVIGEVALEETALAAIAKASGQ